MRVYVLKRVILMLPTLILIVMVAFFLSKMVPGDQAESLLSLQGILPDSKNAKVEYKRNYLQIGLDKPNFYISINPDFYPDNINSIISSSDRQQVSELLNQKIPFNLIEEYRSVRDKFIDEASSLSIDSSNYDKYRSILQALIFASEIDEIKDVTSKISQNSSTFPPSAHLIKASEKMFNGRASFYFPTIRWHGKDNQFHHYFMKIVMLDFGTSLKDGRKVSEKIGTAVRWTLILLLFNLFFTTIIAVPTGLFAGFYPTGLFDKLSHYFWLIFYAIPVFWLASLLIIYFTTDQYGSWTNIFPTPGTWYIPEDQSIFLMLGQYSSQLILPIICLVANDVAQLSRITRNNVVEQKNKIYSLMARAKGLSNQSILKNHILPNVLIPLVTIIGSRIPAGLSGSLIIEVIFNIPGMGRLMYDSIFAADWNVVFSILIVISITTMFFLLITDLVYSIINPKIKL